MKLFESDYSFRYPWHRVSAATWVKYPNEATPHVIHVDYLQRSVDPQTGVLTTTRILTCKPPSFPQFLLKWFGAKEVEQSYVYEESRVDPRNQTMTLKTKNLNFNNLLDIEETCTYVVDQNNPDRTLYRQEARIHATAASASSFFSSVRNKLEEFSLSNFQANAPKGRLAMEQALAKYAAPDT